MSVKIVIYTGNSAFDDDNYYPEIERILKEIAKDYHDCSPKHTYRDINGNIVCLHDTIE